MRWVTCWLVTCWWIKFWWVTPVHLLAPIRFEATQEKLPKSAAVLLQEHFRRGAGAGEQIVLLTVHYG